MAVDTSEKKHSGPIVESRDRFDVIDCTGCGFRHILPIPSQVELEKVYRSEYYTQEKPLYIERNLEDQEWWKVVYDGRFDLFERLLPFSPRRLLDVGSGPGFFLRRGEDRGWQCVGIEPSRKAATFARAAGLTVKRAFLSEVSAVEMGTFDVVYMNEVLEHTPDPTAILRQSMELLKPSGLLCIVVPNDYNPLQKALQDVCGFPSWWVAPPHHINYFNVTSVKALVQKVGLEIVDVEATFPIDLFLLMGENYVGNDELGRKCHGRRKNLELNLKKAGLNHLKHTLYHFFAELGIGREVQVIARRR
jgi:SAM-dependent methyltransferase